MNFEDLQLSKHMLETLEEIGFSQPSEIQARVIPQGLKGRDIIGQAQTGTGKTAAFGIPIIETTKKGEGLQHVILAPSRELAVQIFNEIRKLSYKQNLKVVEIIGGISYTKQELDLRKKPEIIVATPGRFIDHMERGRFNFEKVRSFTLDEADEMLNFGFYKEILSIFKKMPKKVQTYFLTATFNKKIKDLAKEILTNPFSVEVSEGLSSSKRVEQRYIVLKEKEKLNTLVSLLHVLNPKAAVVFGRTKRRVDELSKALIQLGFSALGIQGDMKQRERSNTMNKFRSGSINIIVGTDVMARGIDVRDVDYVFNFDLPTEIEYYTHRIGRTGRANKKGVAISFVKDIELGYFKQVMKMTNSEVHTMSIPTNKEISNYQKIELNDNAKKLLLDGAGSYVTIGQELAKQFTKEELGIIVATSIIGKRASPSNISLTGESGVAKKQTQKKSYKKNNFKSKKYNHNKNNEKYKANIKNYSQKNRSN